MPARDHLNPRGRHKPTLDRAVPETREDGLVKAPCDAGTLFAWPNPPGAIRPAVGGLELPGGSPMVSMAVTETELRTCIAALTSVLGQLDPDHPERKAA